MQEVRKATALALDVVIATLALVLIAPLFAAIAICVAIESKGHVFYRAHRTGYQGRKLAVLKFTKMQDVEGPPLTTDDDERFTRIGRLLARTKLDELPQLLNVVRGDMALVGPRPEDPQFIALHPDSYAEILSVRPGITGVSQLAYASESRILESEDPVSDYVDRVLPQKVGLDTRYAASKSIVLDLKVLFWTIAAVVLRQDVAVNRRTLNLTLRGARRHAPAVPVRSRPHRVPEPVGVVLMSTDGAAAVSPIRLSQAPPRSRRDSHPREPQPALTG
jgi:lipopolysaccharide/colanic/teichoic acid biosynthesis glycosyltransferase